MIHLQHVFMIGTDLQSKGMEFVLQIVRSPAPMFAADQRRFEGLFALPNGVQTSGGQRRDPNSKSEQSQRLDC